MDVKANYLLLETKKRGRGERMMEARRLNERHGDGFSGPGGHSANLKAWSSFLQDSWCFCSAAPPLSHDRTKISKYMSIRVSKDPS